MWVCDGIELSVGMMFNLIVFIWLLSATLFGPIFVSMQLVYYEGTQRSILYYDRLVYKCILPP